MKKPIRFLVSPLGLLCLVSILHFGSGASSISQTLTSKFSQVIDKLNALKKSSDKEKEPVAAASSKIYSLHTAEAREPSSGYGHSSSYGHGYSSYGGHGGGGGGKGYGSSHGAITLDPVSIISLLALGAFLINNILQLLRANSMMTMMSGRSLDVADINIPLDLSDIGLGGAARELKEDTDSTTAANEGGEPSFSNFFKNVGSLYYLAPKKRNICIKKVVCNYVSAQQREGDPSQGSLRTKIFDIMLTTITTLVAPEINEDANNKTGGGGHCLKFNKYCSDSVLRDAKKTAEEKVYGQVTSMISKFALSKLLSG